MKNKIIYICIIGALGLLVSCADKDFRFNTVEEDGDGIYLNLSISMPEMQSMVTRGVLDDGELNPGTITADFLKGLNLYMFIFENDGSPESNYLRALVHGDDIQEVSTTQEPAGGEHPEKMLRTFKAKVDGTSADAIIHLVATADPDFEKQLQNLTDRSELGLFYGATGLYTSGVYPAFWKRIDLGMPIKKYDETKEDERGKNDELKEKLSHIQLVRNFCRVTVNVNQNYTTEEQTAYLKNFKVLGYTLVNQVDHGYVAAYSDNDPRGFIDFEKFDNDGTMVNIEGYGDIMKYYNYSPSRHPLSQREHKDENTDWISASKDDVFDMNAKYMFERPYQQQHHTYVIVKGVFGNNTEARYIKLDVGDIPQWKVDDQGFVPMVFEQYHFIRNFSYNITINTIANTEIGSKKRKRRLRVLPPTILELQWKPEVLRKFPTEGIKCGLTILNLSSLIMTRVIQLMKVKIFQKQVWTFGGDM